MHPFSSLLLPPKEIKIYLHSMIFDKHDRIKMDLLERMKT